MVLSFSPNAEALQSRETALRKGGLEVISVMSEAEARYEIMMGRCGVLLICYRLSEADAQYITRIFKEYCPQGRVVFVFQPSKGKNHVPSGADFVLPESAGAEEIVQALKEVA